MQLLSICSIADKFDVLNLTTLSGNIKITLRQSFLMYEYLRFNFILFFLRLKLPVCNRIVLYASLCIQTLALGASAPTYAQNQPTAPNMQNYARASQGLVKELESGLSRIQKNCGELITPAFKDGYPTDVVMAKIKTSNAISDAEMKKVTNKVSTSSQSLLGKAPSRCQLPGFAMIDSSCKAIDLQISKFKSIEADAQALHKETVERYKFYVLAIQLENSNCARSGFASKLWQTEEQYVQPNLLRFSGFFIQQIDDFLSKP